MTIFLYDIHYIRKSDASAQVLRLSSVAYTTKRTDTPANTKYHDLLKRGGSIARYMWGFGRSYAESGAEVGNGVLMACNGEGFFDQYAVNGDGFDYQKIEVYTVPKRSSSFAEATLYATFICEKVVYRWGEVEFIIRDPLFLINRPINDSLFAGDNADADDLEGNAGDIGGKRKPVTIGKCFHVPLTQINTQSIIYGCHFDSDGSPAPLVFDEIYDKVTPLVDDGDDADSATLATATITLDYRTCEAEGLARLDATPAGVVTADVTEGATAGDRTAAQCAKRLITEYAIGFTPAFDAASFTALDSADSSVVGFYSDGSDSLYDVCSQLLFSVDAALLVSKTLEFYVAQIIDPAGETAIATFTENDIVDEGEGLESIDVSDETRGLPSYKTTTLYSRYFQSFNDSDLASGLSDAVRNDALNEWRTTPEATTLAVQDVNKSSVALELASCLTDATKAGLRNTARHSLRNVDRFMFSMTLQRETLFEIGDVIELKVDRFGMAAGKKFIILGYEIPELTEPRTEYLIYG